MFRKEVRQEKKILRIRQHLSPGTMNNISHEKYLFDEKYSSKRGTN